MLEARGGDDMSDGKEDEDRQKPSVFGSSGCTGKKDKNLQPIGKDLDEPHTTMGSSQNPRSKWSTAEVQAVEKSLMDNIRSGKVPGKAQCMACIESSPAALQGRSWEGVKFYVKNRIDALKRKM